MIDPPPTPGNDPLSDRDPARLLALIQSLAREIRPDRGEIRVTLSSDLDRDLGFDSLGRAELLLRVERVFSVKLSESLLVEAETPAHIWRAIEGVGSTELDTPASFNSTSSLGPVDEAPVQAETLTGVLDWHVTNHPDRTHIWLADGRGGAETISYEKLSANARAVALGLLDAGLAPGARVALMLPSTTDFFYAFFGILYAGCIPVPIYPPARPSQLEDHLRRQAAILDNAGAEIMITVREARTLALFLRAQVATLRAIETVERLSARTGSEGVVAGAADDIAFLQYTSGSTGDPKGVLLSHANLLANIRAMGQTMKVDPNHDVFVSWLPLYHDMGLIGAWLGSLYFAVPVSIMSPLVFLARPESWLWEIHLRRGTLSGAPNFAFDLCASRIDDRNLEGLDLSSARMVVNGAEPVRPDSVRAFCERFAKYGFDAGALAPVYGLAENSVGLAFPDPGRGLLSDRIDRAMLAQNSEAVPVSAEHGDAVEVAACGKPIPGHEIRIVDDTGREVADRRQGRLQFSGPSATRGYYRNEAKTKQLYDGDWLETGDLAYVAGGDVYLTGRVKDIIIRGGRNIYPHEVEAAVGALDGVRQGCVAVFAAPTPDQAEKLVVVAETRETATDLREQLRRQIDAKTLDIAGIAPDDVILAPPRAVLKTSSGKIRRSATGERYLQGRLEETGHQLWWQIVRMVMSGVGPGLRTLRRTIFDYTFAAYWWTVFALLALIVWPLSIVLPRPSVLRFAARAMLKLTGTDLTVDGEPLGDRGGILVANHCSYLDSLVLIAALDGKVDFVAKAELAPQLFAGTFLRRIGTLFVERFEIDRGVDDMQIAIDAARAGRRLLIYPEGTLTRRPGLLAFKLGAFAVAAAADVPAVPITVRGTRSILRGGQWFPRPGDAHITVGAELSPDGDGFEAAIKLRDLARSEILAQCGEPDLVGESTLLRDSRRKVPVARHQKAVG